MYQGFANALVLVLLHLMLASAAASEPPSVQRWDRVVCIQTKSEGTSNRIIQCSAFLVNNQSRLFLVTAGHASDETNRRSRVVFRDQSGKSQWVKLDVLFPQMSNPWKRDKNSDFAIAEVSPAEDKQVYLTQLMAISIPLANLGGDTPSRTTKIETAGYPLGIGAVDPISPVVVVGHIASAEISTESDWGVEPIIYGTPALAQGTSGGPTFLSDESPDSAMVIGMYVGVVFDASGAKLSKMTPSRLIHQAIAESCADDP